MSDQTTYTGEVSPGGPADVRELTHLTITKVAVDKEMSNNCYLLRCKHTGDQVLIDAAAEPDTLTPLVGDAGLDTIVTTHQHWDHHRALPTWSTRRRPRPSPASRTRTRSPPRPASRSPGRSRTATPSRSATARSR